MVDPLKDLKRLGETAMGPCVVCDRQLLETGFPIFFRIEAKQCGLDGQEIKRHVGLAMSMGGGQVGLTLASIMGPGVKPVIVMEEVATFNVCHGCATDGPSILDVICRQWDRDRVAKGLRTGNECAHCSEQSVTNLDGDNLCQKHADEWVRGEGQAVHEAEERERDHGPEDV